MADFYDNKQVTEEVILVGVALGETSVTDESLDELEELAHMVQSMALCGLGKSAPLPVISTLNRFRDEYVEHIRDKKCHAKVCTHLRDPCNRYHL